MMYSTQWIFLASLLILAGGVKQQIEIFSEPSQRGSSIILADKIPDLKDWKFFLENAKSYCTSGLWDFFALTNYDGNVAGFHGSGGMQYAYEQRRCENYSNFGLFNSARYNGPADTRTIGISIHEKFAEGGVEVVVEGREGNNFPMNTTGYIISHGASNWTLYTENNFEGMSWCFRSDGNLLRDEGLNSTHPVRSVLRDCD